MTNYEQQYYDETGFDSNTIIEDDYNVVHYGSPTDDFVEWLKTRIEKAEQELTELKSRSCERCKYKMNCTAYVSIHSGKYEYITDCSLYEAKE